MFQRLLAPLAGPRIRLPLAVLGTAALAAGLVRLWQRGLDGEAIIALAIGGGALALLALAASMSGRGQGRFELPAGLRTGHVTAGIVALLVAGGLFYTLPAARNMIAGIAPMPRLAAPARTIEGRATAVAGDRLRIAGTTVKLNGIEAPERDQQCQQSSGKRWRCGQAAADAMGKLVNGKNLTCTVSDGASGATATCKHGDTDLAAELVRGGHVFAAEGLFAAYAGDERIARDAKVGVWKGEAERPSEYRAKRWEEASRAAPEGCPIKGRITSQGRYYLLPWSTDYGREKVRSTRGERWFCTEAEAQAAGWKLQDRS